MDASHYSTLVMDKFATLRRIVSNVLRQAGFEPHSDREGGAEGLRKLERHRFPCIRSDWNMPKMTGLTSLTAALETWTAGWRFSIDRHTISLNF